MAKLGDRATPGTPLFLDEKPLKIKAQEAHPRVLVYHKPIGEMVTRSDPQGRPTVFDRLPPGRWVAVGRLDVNTSGLLLFTDSGELANRLMHPRYEVEREYEVRVQGGLSDAALRKLLSGVRLEDGIGKFLSLREVRARAETGTNRWYRAVLAEGRNREVRRLIEAAGGRVSRLRRLRFGRVSLPAELAPGRCQELDAEAVSEIVRGMKSC